MPLACNLRKQIFSPASKAECLLLRYLFTFRLKTNFNVYFLPGLDGELPEIVRCKDTFSASIQSAKIAGLNSERVQGMKALLFDSDEDFLSPREKSLLANRSLIADGIREIHLKQRFDVRKKIGNEGDNLEYSLLSETLSPTQNLNKVPKRTKLLKSKFGSDERGKWCCG